MKRTIRQLPISQQVQDRLKKPIEKRKKLEGNIEVMVSTGSTLLDLAICGTRIRGGGLPGGIAVEVFGPPNSGKTVLLCEIGGDIQRKGGELQFHDPEARLNQQFSKIFDLTINKDNYHRPNVVPEVFDTIKKWVPKNKAINGCLTDSLAALSTDLEMSDKGDKMGMRRAKELSEGFRTTARIITTNNILMVCSNQIREVTGAGEFEEKWKSPGGWAIGFYCSVRLRVMGFKKIKRIIKFKGKDHFRIIGIEATIEVYKNSTDKPYRRAPLTILFDYGIDDIRQNLQYIKDFTKNTIYMVGNRKLSNSMEESIAMIEKYELEKELKEQVIDLWTIVEAKFDISRKTKKR